MSSSKTLNKRHRYPPDFIQYAVWLYHRFNLSQRDIEDLLAERGIIVSYESIRLWCIKFGPKFTRRLSRWHQGFGGTFFIDEVFVKIQGKQQNLWRAVDQDDEVACLCVLEMCGGVKGQYLQEFSRIEKLTSQYRSDRLSLIII